MRFASDPVNPFPYHEPRHSEEVTEILLRIVDDILVYRPGLLIDGLAEITRTLNLNPTGPQFQAIIIVLTESLGLGHDLVQERAVNELGEVVRRAGIETTTDTHSSEVGKAGNEFRSASEIYTELKRYFYEDGQPVFPGLTFEMVLKIVSTTYVESAPRASSDFIAEFEKITPYEEITRNRPALRQYLETIKSRLIRDRI